MPETYPEIASDTTSLLEDPKDNTSKVWILAKDEDLVYSLKKDIEDRITYGVVGLTIQKERYVITGRIAFSLYLEYQLNSDAYTIVYSFVEGWLCARDRMS